MESQQAECIFSSRRWHFNPPHASHMGGAWERPIRTVRKVSSGPLKEQVLDDEGLQTLLCEVKSIINERPMTQVSDDPRDAAALTPNYLLLLKSNYCRSPGVFSKSDCYGKRRSKQVQYLAGYFLEEMDQGVFTNIADTTRVASHQA